MAFNEIKYTQSVWHYQELKRKFWLEGENRVLSLYLRPPDARCPKCKSRNVATYKHRNRTLIGLPYGKCQVRFVVPVRKVICRDCKAVTYERVAFAAYKNARITRLLAKKLLARAADVSMKSLAEEYRISWRTVRDAIEDGLRKRYRRRDYSKVRNIGVDELYVFRHERPSRRFITTVRDQDAGTVLDVARGKGAVALKRFERKIAPYKENIKTVSMDMASSYTSWAAGFLPEATIVIDRFHVMKALNDRVDKARRKVMAMVDEKTAKKIKGNRYVFLKNRDKLTPKEERKLERAGKIKECSTLMEVHLFKERMRSIYTNAKTYADAAPLFDEWISDAEASEVPELKSAAKTFRRNRDGILAYWSTGGMSNSATEGFNRKTRGLLETAYGFHDYKFLRLRIFDLGEKKSIKD
ncbi:MAG: ISL3 family transposase [Clostridia bacterium]|nr:ISL3 family transposase [Clostridia bacterium]